MANPNKIVYFLKLSTEGFKKGLQKATHSVNRFRDKVKSSFARVGKYIKSSILPMIAFSGAMYKLFSSISQGAEEFRKLELEFANINTLLDGPGGLSDSAKNAIRELSKVYGNDAIENARAYYGIVSKGIQDETQALELLNQSNMLATAGKAKLETSTNALLTATNAYSQANLSAKDAADGLLAIVKNGRTDLNALATQYGVVAEYAANAGLTFKELNAYLSAATQSGQTMSQTVTGLKAVVTNLIKVTPRASAEAKRLGIDFGSTAIKAKGFTKFMEDLIRVTKGGTDAQVLSKLFDSSEAVASMQTAMKTYNEMFKKMQDTTGLVEKGSKKILNTSAKQLEILEKRNKDAWATKPIEKLDFAIKKLTKNTSYYTAVVLNDLIKQLIAIGTIGGKLGSKVGIKGFFNSVKNMVDAVLISVHDGLKKLGVPKEALRELAAAKPKPKAKQEDKQPEQKAKQEAKKTDEEQSKKESVITANFEKLAKVKEKILELTQKTMETLASGISKIREETQKALQSLKDEFFSGSAIRKLAETSKLIKESGVGARYESLTRMYDKKDLTAEIRHDLAQVAKHAKDNQVLLGGAIRLFESLKQINPSLKASKFSDFYHAYRTDKNLEDSFVMGQHESSFRARRDDIERQGKMEEEELRKKLLAGLKDGVDGIVESAKKNKIAGAENLKAAKLFKEAVEKHQKALQEQVKKDEKRDIKTDKEVTINLKTTGDLKQWLVAEIEKSNQNNTQNNKAFNQKDNIERNPDGSPRFVTDTF